MQNKNFVKNYFQDTSSVIRKLDQHTKEIKLIINEIYKCNKKKK